jgi:hypothetical protein
MKKIFTMFILGIVILKSESHEPKLNFFNSISFYHLPPDEDLEATIDEVDSGENDLFMFDKALSVDNRLANSLTVGDNVHHSWETSFFSAEEALTGFGFPTFDIPIFQNTALVELVSQQIILALGVNPIITYNFMFPYTNLLRGGSSNNAFASLFMVYTGLQMNTNTLIPTVHHPGTVPGIYASFNRVSGVLSDNPGDPNGLWRETSPLRIVINTRGIFLYSGDYSTILWGYNFTRLVANQIQAMMLAFESDLDKVCEGQTAGLSQLFINAAGVVANCDFNPSAQVVLKFKLRYRMVHGRLRFSLV